MDENRLTDEFLELRSQSISKGIIYIIIGNSPEISIFYPKGVMNSKDNDEFFKFLLGSSEFEGRTTIPSSIWKSLVIDPWSRDYYKFSLKDSYIELTTVGMSEIVKTPL